MTAEKVRELTSEAIGETDIELLHIEVIGPKGKPTVRIIIDKPGGITHDDCSRTSNAVEQILDREDFIDSAYVLEVSSPGIERGLYSLQDFEKYSGKNARVKSRVAVNGQRNFRGMIIGLEDQSIVFEDRTNGLVKIPIGEVAKARLEVDMTDELRRKNKRRK